MELISRTFIATSNKDRFRFYFVGDAHYGTVAFDEDLFKRTVQHIKHDANGYVILMGDMAECINYSDKRFDPRTIPIDCRAHMDDLSRYQVEKVTEFLSPIADKILVILDGNHEDKLRKSDNPVDFNWRLRDNLKDLGGSPVCGGDIAVLRAQFKRIAGANKNKPRSQQFIFLVSHGFGAGRTKGAKINRVQEMVNIIPEADIYCLGHHHDKVLDRVSCFELSVGTRDNLHLIERRKLLGITGSFYRTYEKGQSNYASKRLYRPADLGCIYAEIKPFGGDAANKYQLDLRDLVL